MKRLSILLVLTIILLNSLYSQERNTMKEVGIYFSNFDAFGIRYKFGNEKHMFRITALSLNFGDSKYKNINGTGVNQNETLGGIGLNVGLEFPTELTENFNFYYGGELSGSYSYNKSQRIGNDANKSNYYRAGIGFVMGFSYRISSNILLSAEIVPCLNYSANTNNSSTTSTRIGFDLNNNSAGITLSYKFNKK